MADWATPESVLALTGVTVDESTCLQAQGAIETFTDADPDSSANRGGLSAKNLKLLEKATAYQAAWIPAHPDWAQNIDATSVQQDGVVISTPDRNAWVCAPMAARCIHRLSWLRDGTMLRIGPIGSYGAPSGTRSPWVSQDLDPDPDTRYADAQSDWDGYGNWRPA
jgi:hypothetical protein